VIPKKDTDMYETTFEAVEHPRHRIKSKTLHRFCCLGLAVGWAVIRGMETEARAAAGATTPFVTFEAEAGTLGDGAIIRSITPGMPVPTVATLELEASGHSLVELKNNRDSVSWVNNTGVTANAIVIRASIPDAPNGGGITATINLYVDGSVSAGHGIGYRHDLLLRGIDGECRGGESERPHRELTLPKLLEAIARKDTAPLQALKTDEGVNIFGKTDAAAVLEKLSPDPVRFRLERAQIFDRPRLTVT
jgi:hypothetical protein